MGSEQSDESTENDDSGQTTLDWFRYMFRKRFWPAQKNGFVIVAGFAVGLLTAVNIDLTLGIFVTYFIGMQIGSWEVKNSPKYDVRKNY